MPAPKRLFALGLMVMFLVVALDQVVKGLIMDEMIVPAHRMVEVAPFFNVVLVWNYGVSFGMFASERQPLLLTGTSLVIVGILLVWLYRNTARETAWALGSVMGGAIGNVIDRVRYGAVVDFLDFHLGNYHWPAFNVADSCIFIGVVVLCGSSMLMPRPNQPLKD